MTAIFPVARTRKLRVADGDALSINLGSGKL